MTTKQVDILNIGLIFTSLFLAFQIPFKLFLFSYAVLGPLHYLTEINWLNKKNYFVKNPKWICFLFALTVLICLPVLLTEVLKIDFFKGLTNLINNSSELRGISKWSANFLFIGIVSSISFVMFKETWKVILSILITTVVAYLLMTVPLYITIIGIFIPTIIHVFVFTAIFILFGAIKSKSKMGYLTVVLMFLSALIIAKANVNPRDFILSEATKQNFNSSTFSFVNISIAKFLGLVSENTNYSLISVVGVKIQIFIAFAYTYHYLNWFSKTSIIKWHQVNKKQFIIIAVIWALSVTLYYYNYRLGFIALLFLSMLHVFYEFPLNIVSMKGVFNELFNSKSRIKS